MNKWSKGKGISVMGTNIKKRMDTETLKDVLANQNFCMNDGKIWLKTKNVWPRLAHVSEW